MSKGGKHLNTAPAGRSSGAHLSEKERRREKTRRARKMQRRSRMKSGIPQMAAMLLLCFLMISPLRGCIISDDSYIGYAAAGEAALADAGIAADKANDMETEMIKIGDTVCYKVQFSGSVTNYRYIIDAQTGTIIGQSFYRTQE